MSTLSDHGFGSEAYSLDREASALKQSGDLDSAIECLRRRKALMGVEYMETKLAKYLQHAGRFDEAMSEIDWLIKHSNQWAEAMFGHQPRSVRRCQQAGLRARLHRDAALLCKREQRPDLNAQHASEAKRWQQLHAQIGVLAERDKQRRRDEWEAARKSGRSAMAAFIQKWRPDAE